VNDLNFTSCSDNCPAVTGEAYGSVKYCPMLENDRHKSLKLSDFPKGSEDLRLAQSESFYQHPDYTDCCANFQCCCSSLGALIGDTAIIQAIPDRECEECGVIEECRPYGGNGKWICFSCGMKYESATAANYIKSINY
jgi:hypothetical protein